MQGRERNLLDINDISYFVDFQISGRLDHSLRFDCIFGKASDELECSCFEHPSLYVQSRLYMSRVRARKPWKATGASHLHRDAERDIEYRGFV